MGGGEGVDVSVQDPRSLAALPGSAFIVSILMWAPGPGRPAQAHMTDTLSERRGNDGFVLPGSAPTLYRHPKREDRWAAWVGLARCVPILNQNQFQRGYSNLQAACGPEMLARINLAWNQ